VFCNNCFIGFGSVVFNCEIGNGCVVLHRTLIKDITIPDNKSVEDGMVVNEQYVADNPEDITQELVDFANKVTSVNLMLS